MRCITDELRSRVETLKQDAHQLFTVHSAIRSPPVMNAGRLLRLRTPHELLAHPGDDFVAALMTSPKRQAEQRKALVAGRQNGGLS
jgi:ABC-type proline/glycine betaine transport system ATPase subunit